MNNTGLVRICSRFRIFVGVQDHTRVGADLESWVVERFLVKNQGELLDF